MNSLQNRKTVAVLIVLAAGLWGGILWRLVRYTGEGESGRSRIFAAFPGCSGRKGHVTVELSRPFRRSPAGTGVSGNKVGTGFPACANLSLSGRASCFPFVRDHPEREKRVSAVRISRRERAGLGQRNGRRIYGR